MEIFSLLPLNFHSTNDEAYDALARHLSALKKGVRDLEVYVTEIDEQGQTNRSGVPKWPPSRRTQSAAHSSHSAPVGTGDKPFVPPIYPLVASFRSLESGERHSFVYEKEMEGRKLLFRGRKQDGERICIKFVRRYGKEVHIWCAGKGIAPKLMGFEALPGGWYMVVMEYLDETWALFDDDKVKWVKGIKGVKEKFAVVIVELHEAGMVHGDIREANVMVKEGGEEFKLVDFDWAGVLGEVRYPRHVNKAVELGRPEDVLDGELILERHDLSMMKKMFLQH